MQDVKKQKVNFIDKVIEYVSPQMAVQRAVARSLLEQFSMGYEGATRGGRLSNWRSGQTDANSALRFDIQLLRDRSRDLIRNDVFANVAKRKVISNLVGGGIRADIKKNEELKKLWNEWALTKSCDITGTTNLYGLQRQIASTIFESGSVLVRVRYRRPDSKNSFPVELQLLEPDYLDSSKDTITVPKSGENRIVNGIEYNSRGKPVYYWLYKSHPGDQGAIFASSESVRVPASEIFHYFRPERIGQSVGVPWLAPAILRIHDFHEYENAQLVRQKIAACYMGFYQLPNEKAANQRFKEKNKDGGLVEKVEPATMEMMPPGYSVHFTNPPKVDDYEEYSKVTLRGIAAGTGLPYEVLTGDLSNVNFSSARLGWIEFQKEIDIWRDDIYHSNFCADIWNLFISNAELLDYNTDAEVNWIEPRQALLDPEKEIKAIVAEIRAGLVSHSEAIRSMGRDPEQVYEEQDACNKEFDKRGLINDADPRKTTNAGIAQIEDPNAAIDKETE